MKTFLRKRWHGIPVGIITVVLLICLTAGGAFAAYQFFTFTAEVTVEEPFTVGLNGDVGGQPPPGEKLTVGGNYYKIDSGFAFSVTLYAGESTRTEGIGHPMIGDRWFNSIVVINDSSSPLTITFDVPESYTGVQVQSWGDPSTTDSYALDGYTFTILGSGSAEPFIMRGIGVMAAGDAAPGTYTFTVTVTRG